MTKRILWLCTSALSLLAIDATEASAQATADQVLHACYIPLVGVVYRIKAPGLPTACLGRNHVEFEWNQTGPRGEKGEPGIAGNLALAGQSCSSGTFVTGFNATGGLICTAVNGQPAPDPSPNPPGPLEGDWNISERGHSACGIVPVDFPTSLRVTSSSTPGHVNVTFGLSISLIDQQVTLSLPIPQPLVFPVPVSGQGSLSYQGRLSGSVTWSVDAQLADASHVAGTLHATANLAVAGIPISCPAMSASFAATHP